MFVVWFIPFVVIWCINCTFQCLWMKTSDHSSVCHTLLISILDEILFHPPFLTTAFLSVSSIVLAWWVDFHANTSNVSFPVDATKIFVLFVSLWAVGQRLNITLFGVHWWTFHTFTWDVTFTLCPSWYTFILWHNPMFQWDHLSLWFQNLVSLQFGVSWLCCKNLSINLAWALALSSLNCLNWSLCNLDD